MRLKVFLACSGITCFLLGVVGASADTRPVPEIKKKCDTCHVSHTMGSERLLKAPLSDLCLDCHPERKPPGDHVVDVKPSMPVVGLPLDEGMMTCVTCHDPHSKGEFPKMLRALPSRICSNCHKL